MRRLLFVLLAFGFAAVPASAEKITDKDFQKITDKDVASVVSRYMDVSSAEEPPAEDPVRQAIVAQDRKALVDAIDWKKVDEPGGAGLTALQIAVTSRKPAMVRFLLEKGADVNARGLGGATALLLAAERGHGRVVETLLEEGADVESTNDDGMTPLMAAVIQERYGTVEALLAAGADPNHRMKAGAAPWDFASFKGNTQLKSLLERYGARPGEAKDAIVTVQ